MPEESDWEHFYTMGTQAIQSGDYNTAEQLWFACLQLVEFTGEDDRRLFTTLDNLAEACYCQGKISQAKNLYWENIAIKEKYIGPESIELANNLKRLAAIYYHQERFTDAVQLGQRVLAIYEKHHGKDHPEIAEICMNLAILAHRQENLADAKQYYERAKSGSGGTAAPKVARQPFDDRVKKPVSTCDICGRIYVGDICLKCTLTTMNAFDTGKHRPIQMKARENT